MLEITNNNIQNIEYERQGLLSWIESEFSKI